MISAKNYYVSQTPMIQKIQYKLHSYIFRILQHFEAISLTLFALFICGDK